jgi:hypothetical protein
VQERGKDHGLLIEQAIRSYLEWHASVGHEVSTLQCHQTALNQFQAYLLAGRQLHSVHQIKLVIHDLATVHIIMNGAYYSDLAEHIDFMEVAQRHVSNIPPLRREDHRRDSKTSASSPIVF